MLPYDWKTALFFGLVLLLGFVLTYDFRHLLWLYRLTGQRNRNQENDSLVNAGATNSANGSERVKVDIVVPIYNMGDSFSRTLRSIEAAPYENKQLIIVDDGSDDGQTPQILADLANRIDILYGLPHSGKAAAANFGARQGQGDVILFLDADSYVKPEFIEVALVELDGQVDAIDFVPQVANAETNIWTKIAVFERELLGVNPDNFGALFAIRRKAFEELEFRDCLAPQFDLNQRLLRNRKLKTSGKKVVFSDEPVTLKRLYRRKRRWVYGMLETCQLNDQAPDIPLLLPIANFVLLGSYALSFIDLRFALIPTVLLSAWLLKVYLLAKILRLDHTIVPWYVFYTIVLSTAVIDGELRFKLKKKVPWT